MQPSPCRGTVISYACAPGEVAYDGATRPGGISYYAEALAAHLGRPEDVHFIADYIARDVRALSAGKQVR